MDTASKVLLALCLISSCSFSEQDDSVGDDIMNAIGTFLRPRVIIKYNVPPPPGFTTSPKKSSPHKHHHHQPSKTLKDSDWRPIAGPYIPKSKAVFPPVHSTPEYVSNTVQHAPPPPKYPVYVHHYPPPPTSKLSSPPSPTHHPHHQPIKMLHETYQHHTQSYSPPADEVAVYFTKHEDSEVHHYDPHSHHPKYHFKYAVNDPHTGDIKSQEEHRDGDRVKGSYSLMESTGHTRTVHYTADKNTGFTAQVYRDGHPITPAPLVQPYAYSTALGFGQGYSKVNHMG